MMRSSPGSDRFRQIEDVFHEAQQYAAEERRAFLARRCKGDDDLRRQVESLLATPVDGGLLETFSSPMFATQGAESAIADSLVGRTIGPYEIRAPIGRGGMGEVYQARDTKLARDVAIKFLPKAFTRDPARVARFVREAQTLASFTHPNIGAIYGIEDEHGGYALVLELVGGETLAERIGRGPVPMGEALAFASQIAEALDVAHQRGIVHRDLKPANIKITADGRVKVLDFGLAQVTSGAGAAADTPTALGPTQLTEEGVVLGTPAYMSPEQARGQVVDKRTDIWAFGCVLFEMLTGMRPFAGETTTDTIAAIMKTEPDWPRLSRQLPTSISFLLRACLEKNSGQRLRDIGDARLLLEASSGEAPAATGTTPVKPWGAFVAAAVALALAAGVSGWFASRQMPAEVAAGVRLRFDIPRAEPPAAGPTSRGIALSPDGSRLAYATASSMRVRSLDGEDVPLPVAGRQPFFSPDGEWLGFFSEDGLGRMPSRGGPVAMITRDVVGRERAFGASWAPDGTIVLSSGGSLWRVSATGGKTELVAGPDIKAGEVRYAWPEFLPDGRSVLFTIVGKESTDTRTAVIDLTSREQKTILQGGHGAQYASTGHLVYASEGQLHVVAFDESTLNVSGVPTMVPGVRVAEITGGFYPDFAISRTGTLAYLPVASRPLRTLAWVDRQGREEPIPAPPQQYLYPRISPDGTRVALDVGGVNRDIWVWHLARNLMTRITEGPTEDLMPAWSPDGARVFFASDREGRAFRVFSVAADGAGAERQEFAGSDSYMPLSMPVMNQLLVSVSGRSSRGGDIGVITLDASPGARLLLAKDGQEGNAQVSPDGRWIAYQSLESGSPEVYVRPFPDVDRRREQISRGGGVQPLWGPPGSNELFYWTVDAGLKVVSLTLTPDLAVGATRDVPLPAGYRSTGIGPAWSYQVSPHDGRLLLMKPVPNTGGLAPIKVVINWFDELQQLMKKQ